MSRPKSSIIRPGEALNVPSPILWLLVLVAYFVLADRLMWEFKNAGAGYITTDNLGIEKRIGVK